MGAEGKSAMQHTRKRPLAEPGEPWAKRRPGNAATATESTGVAVSMHKPRSRQLDDGIASDRRSSAAGSTPSTHGVLVHFCGHCQKRFRSPAKLARHERVHAVSDSGHAFHCSFCTKQFITQSKAAQHERTHTGEKPYACSYCGRTFAKSGAARRHERTLHRGTV